MTTASHRRRVRASTTVAMATALAAVAVAVSGALVELSAWRDVVGAEVPDWPRVVAGRTSAPLDTWRIEVDPAVLEAAELLRPADRDARNDDRHWFRVELLRDGARHAAEAQLLDGGRRGLRIRFDGKKRPDGMRGIELVAAPATAGLRTWFEREAARNAGLVAPPSGFARLAVNGAVPELVAWAEEPSDAMLQRLGFAAGEIFLPVAHERRGAPDAGVRARFEPARGARAPRAQERAIDRLVALVEQAGDGPLPREIEEIVDVDRALAFDALAHALGARRAEAGWYFDPISGLLVPYADGFVDAPVDADALAPALVRALVREPRHAARRAELLASLTAPSPDGALARADERLGAVLARVGTEADWWARPSRMSELALARRGVRAAWRAGAARSRTSFALAAERAGSTAGDALAAAAEAARLEDATTALRALVRERGLRMRVAGDELRVPAGRHRISETLVVPATHRLVIEPGARLVMAPRASIVTYRGLRAVGTRQAPIAIVAADAQRAWGTIGVVRAPESSELAYVTVSGGSHARHEGVEFTGELAFNASDVAIRDSDVVAGRGDDALSVKRGLFQVRRTRFIDNASDGFDAEWSSGSVEQSLFANNGDDGLDLAASDVRVERTWFRRMGDKAVSAGEGSHVRLLQSQLVDSQIAVASKEDSRVEVRGTEFRRNEIGISLYRDNAIFGSGYGVVTGGLFTENVRDFAVESGSGLTLNGVERRAVDPDGIVVGLRSATAGDGVALP